MGEMKNPYNFFLFGSLKGKDHTEHLGIDGKIILTLISGK
jgi:hypothetical protein